MLRMDIVVIVLVFLSVFKVAVDSQDTCSEDQDYPSGTWQSKTFLNETENEIILYKDACCKGVFINVNKLDLDGYRGDIIVLNSTRKNQNATGKIFTWHLNTTNKPKKYLVHGNRIELAYIMGTNSISGNNTNQTHLSAFEFNYECNGNPYTTTTEATTTENPYPVTKPEDHLEIHLRKITKEEFELKKLTKFREMLSSVTENFCNDNNLTFNNTTKPFVNVTSIKQCSYTWPDYKHCTEVNFSIPLVPNEEETNAEYQLNVTNLLKMWKIYADTILNELHLTITEKPDEHIEYVLWMVTVGVTLLIILMYLILLRYLFTKQKSIKPKKYMNVENKNEENTIDGFDQSDPGYLRNSIPSPEKSKYECAIL